MSMNDLYHELLKEYCRKLESANEYFLGLYAQGFMSKDELRRSRENEYDRYLSNITDDAEKRCKEQGISFDSNEFSRMASVLAEERAAVMRKAIGLKLVPYQYHPADLGFDELIDDGTYIMNNRIVGVGCVYDDPDPVNKSFDLSIKLDNEGGIAEVPCRLTVDSIKVIESDGLTRKELRGYYRFTGYCGRAILQVVRVNDEYLSKSYLDTNKNRNDPVWNKPKTTWATGYKYANIEDD